MKRFDYLETGLLQDVLARLDKLAAEIGALRQILKPKGQLTLEELGVAEVGGKIVAKKFNRGGTTVADMVAEKMEAGKNFSPREAFEAIEPFMAFNAKRPVDSVRSALKRDKRFQGVGDGQYRRIR